MLYKLLKSKVILMTNLNEKCNNLNMKKLTLKLWKKMSLSGSSIEPHVDHG